MSSIDNRVVILSFDNKDFEKNVQTSMSTLDKLKNNLDLSQSAKGLTALATSAKMFDLGPMGAAIESIKNRFSTLGVIGMTVIQNLTNAAVNFGKNLISAAITPLTSGGWKRALNIEQATFQMEGLLGKTADGAKKIEDIMASVKTSVQGTAYGMDEAARVASQLVATGIEDSDLMLKYLQGVAGAAAMTGGSYDEIGHIFTTVAGNGRLMGEQLQQFAYRGLNIAATLSKQMGITEQEFRDLVSKGKISFQQFADGMASAFGEQATKANETFTGSLSNMKAALARIGEEFATPALKNFRDIFNSLRLLIDAVHERLKPLIDLLNDKFAKTAKKTVDFIDSITEALGGTSSRMKKEMEEVSDTVEGTANKVTQSSEEIEEAARKVINGEYGNGEERRRQLEALGLSYEEVQNRVNELLGCDYRYEVETKEFAATTKDAAEQTEELANQAENLNKNLAISTIQNFVQGVKHLVAAFKTVGSAAVNAFKNVFSSEKFLTAINKISEKFREFAAALVPTNTEARGLQKIFEVLFKIIETGLLGVGKFVELILSIGTVFADLGSKILHYIGIHSDLNGELDETSRKAQFLEAFRAVLEKLKNAFTELKDKVSETIEKIKQTEGFKTLKQSLENLWELIKNIGGKIIDKVIEKMNLFANTDTDFSWLDKVAEVIGKIAGHVGNFIQMCIDGIPSVKDFFKKLFGLDDKDTEKVGETVEKITDKVGLMEERLDDVVGGKGKSFMDFLIKIRDFIIEVKDNIVNFFSGNIDESMKNTSFSENIKNFFIGLGTAIINITENIDLKKVLSAAAKLVLLAMVIKTLASISGAFDSIRDLFIGIKDKLKLDSGPDITEKIRNIGISILLIAGSLFLVAAIPVNNLIKAGIAISAMIGVVALIAVLMDKLQGKSDKGKNATDLGNTLVKMGSAILLIAASMKVIGSMETSDVVKAGVAISALVAVFAIAAKALDKVKAGAGAFIAMALAMDILIPAVLVFGNMKTEKLAQAGVAIVAFLMSMATAAKIAKGSAGAALSFGMMAVAMDLLIPAILVFGNMKTKKLVQAGTAVVAFLTSMALATRICDSAIGGAASMGIMALALDLLIPAILVFGNMDTGKLVKAGVTVVALMTSLAAATKLAKGNISGAASMAIMAASLLLAAGSLKMLADCDWHSLLAAAASLSGLMIALGVALKLSDGIKPNVLGFAAMLIPLAGAVAALYILKDIPWETLLAGGTALSMVMLSIGAAMKLGADAEPMAALALDVVSLSIIPIAYGLTQLADYDWQNILGAATGLSEVLLACAGAMKIMEGMQPAVAAVTALSIDIALAIIGGFVVGFTTLLGKINEWTEGGFLQAVQGGKEILETVGQAIGGFIGGIGEGITSALPAMGENLSAFAENMKGFFEAVREYGPDAGVMIAELAASFAIITGAEFLDGIFSLLNGGESSLTQFGRELSGFGGPFKEFAESVKGIDTDSVAGAAEAMKNVAIAAGAIPNEGGLLADLIGDNTLSKFGPELRAFGPSLKSFWDNCKSIQTGDLSGAASALTEVATAADEIPNEGGFLAKITGDNTLSSFGPQLSGFGVHLKTFWNDCKSIGEGDLTGASKALKEICSAANEIPNEGGFLAVIIGENSLSKFGPELSAFGPHLKQFATDVSGLEGKESAVTAAATALKQIISAAAEIPNQGLSVVSIFVGDNTLSKFGEELEKFGPHMATFADSIKDIPVTKMLTVAATMPKLVQMAVDAENVSTTILDDFGAALNLFGGNLKDYYDAIADVSTSKIQQVIQTVYRLIEVGNEMATVETGAMADFGSALENVGKTGVDLFISAFEDSHDEAVTAVNNFVQVAEDGVSDFISEFQNQSDAAYQAAAGLVSYAAMGATSNNLDFYYAGENAAYGLVNGFSSVANYAYSVAYAMAVNMANTIRNALRIFSPSRVMYELGDYAGMGLVLGFKDTLPDVESVSEQAANVIIDSVATPLEQLQNAVGDNLDLEPVITPVLDLSNVYDGSNALSGMFNGGTARMSYISSFDANTIDPILALADRISENATSGDSVINAINEIRSEVTNLGSAITRMKVWLDGQTMVGELIDPLDQAFGERMGLRERGLY